METTTPESLARLNKRWKTSEIKIMKQRLKANQGNQTKTARELAIEMNRTPTAVQVKLSKLAQKHKSLRKSHIRRKLTQRTRVAEPNAGKELMQKIVLFEDHVRIYF